jgi:two-component system phosphate regulon response regulator PhoB
MLGHAGFAVTVEAGAGVFAAVERSKPDLVVIDWNLPGTLVLGLLGRLQEVPRTARPGLVAIAEGCDERQLLYGFELGVDDFVFKPYSVPEIVARVRAIVRTRSGAARRAPLYRVQDLCIDPHTHEVTARGQPVRLRAVEFRLLQFLLQNVDRVFTRDQLLTHVWGSRRSDARAVDVTVQRTRKALLRHGCSEYLQTVRGFGYRLSEPESRECNSVVAARPFELSSTTPAE